jgi:AcrR family transcriptional regulator
VTGRLDPAPPGRRTERVPRARRRQQIIGEATRIIGQRGYYGFSVQELADSCGLTVAGLLHHVGSKEELLIAVLQARDQHDRDALGEWAAAYRAQQPGRPSLAEAAAVLRQVVVRNAAQPELVRLYAMLSAESLYPDHPAREYFTTREEQVLAAFARLFDGLTSHPVSLARQMLALMSGLEQQWLLHPATMDLVAEWDLAMNTIITSLARTRGESTTAGGSAC